MDHSTMLFMSLSFAGFLIFCGLMQVSNSIDRIVTVLRWEKEKEEKHG